MEGLNLGVDYHKSVLNLLIDIKTHAILSENMQAKILSKLDGRTVDDIHQNMDAEFERIRKDIVDSLPKVVPPSR